MTINPPVLHFYFEFTAFASIHKPEHPDGDALSGGVFDAVLHDVAGLGFLQLATFLVLVPDAKSRHGK